MQTDEKNGLPAISGRHRALLLAAALMTYVLVTAGGVVCATESGYGCPDWPGCYGRALPPPRLDAIIEYTHRLITLLAAPLIVGAAVAGWWKTRRLRWVSWPSLLTLLLAILVSIFGALVVLRGLGRGWAAVDLGSALLALALIVTAAVVAATRYQAPETGERLSLRPPLARLAAATVAVTFAVLVSGVLVDQSASIERCLGWPLYRGAGVPADPAGWFLLGRRLLAIGGLVLIAALYGRIEWGPQEQPRTVEWTARAVAALMLAHLGLGVLLLAVGFQTILLILYVATVVGVWTLLVALLVMMALRGPVPDGLS